MVKPLRALTAARLQVLWNTVHRGRGALGFVAAVLLLLAGVACLIPPGGLFVRFGQVLGEDLAATDSPAMIWLAGLHALIVFGHCEFLFAVWVKLQDSTGWCYAEA